MRLWHGACSGESQGDPGTHREVGVKRDPIKTADAEWGEPTSCFDRPNSRRRRRGPGKRSRHRFVSRRTIVLY